eukprot:EG_transcript_2311
MDVMVQTIQQLLMTQAIEKFDARVTEGEKEMYALVLMTQVSGVLEYDFRPSQFNIQRLGLAPFLGQTFVLTQSHPFFTQVSVIGGLLDPDDDSFLPTFWVTWVALYIDILNKTNPARTLYSTPLAIAANEQVSTVNITLVDQVTSKPKYLISSQTTAAAYFKLTVWVNGWLPTLSFNRFTGQVEIVIRHKLLAQNGSAVQLAISISAATISDELRGQLDGFPKDRLVLFFRQPNGYMIAASHGKYFSHSDVDPRYINPLTNPVNTSAYRLWTCLQSDDPLIAPACQQLYGRYQSWPAIPELQQEMVLQGQRYWVAVGYSSSSLPCAVLMLTDRASVMGSIDASNARVDQAVSDKKGVTIVVIGIVSAIAVLLPLGMGLWLASRLHTLIKGMDRIARLQFTATAMPPTVFAELHRFQASFTQMERGLQAFGKFVPQGVVKVLIAGQMKANDDMQAKTLTIMFADIEGFSTICEGESSAVLVAVCTEYFEVMCDNIVHRSGTIDKFIGDCIMAMWNAPETHPGHERAAVSAALGMQSSVMELHKSWRARGLPVLKFRMGIHTGECLVGNFGCSYRVSYTCVGDGVNLASRLEALNKKFGTYLCVSHSTYEGCQEDFHFRRLARVTVPGKAEVLPVYEVLCEVEQAEALTPSAALPPGVVSLDLSDAEPDKTSAALPPGVTTLDLSDAEPDKTARVPLKNRQYGYFPATTSSLVESLHAPTPILVPYHWTRVDRTVLLQSAGRYEEAYAAMVAGDPQWARQLLAVNPLLDPPDKAWGALASQLEHTEPGHPWDGVFYFKEK